MNDQEWGAVLLGLTAGWPDVDPLPDAISDAWRGMLDGLRVTAVLAAIKSFIGDGERFRPNVGQILRRAVELSSPRPPDFEVAWSEILRIARSLNPHSSPTWSHPLIAETVALVGLRTICNAEEGDRALRAHVRSTYETLATRAAQDERYAIAGIDRPRPEAIA